MEQIKEIFEKAISKVKEFCVKAAISCKRAAIGTVNFFKNAGIGIARFSKRAYFGTISFFKTAVQKIKDHEFKEWVVTWWKNIKWLEVWDRFTTGVLVVLMCSPLLIVLYLFLWFWPKFS